MTAALGRHAVSSLAAATCAVACATAPAYQPPEPTIVADTAAITVIPFELFDGRINVRATVGGESAWLILDSGAWWTSLDRGWARRIGARPLRDSSFALLDTMRLGSLTLRTFGVGLLDMRPVNEGAGRFQAGILGGELLRHFTVEIDYRNRMVRLHDPSTYVYAGPGVVLPFVARWETPIVSSSILLPNGDSVQSRLLLDTGNGSLCVILFTYFAAWSQPAREPRIDGPLVTGLAGPLHVAVGRIRRLGMGTLAVDSVPAGLGREKKSFLATTRFDGLLGGRLFRGGRVIIDYARYRVIVEPDAVRDRDCSYDESGLLLKAQGPDYGRIDVSFVVPGSPAADSGIQIGDQLLAIDDRSTADLTLPEIRKALTGDGAIRRVRIARGVDTIFVTLQLRRLI